MTKFNQLTQAEHMYIYDKKSLAEIGMQLGLSRRILFYWKKQSGTGEKERRTRHGIYDRRKEKRRHLSSLIKLSIISINKFKSNTINT